MLRWIAAPGIEHVGKWMAIEEMEARYCAATGNPPPTVSRRKVHPLEELIRAKHGGAACATLQFVHKLPRPQHRPLFLIGALSDDEYKAAEFAAATEDAARQHCLRSQVPGQAGQAGRPPGAVRQQKDELMRAAMALQQQAEMMKFATVGMPFQHTR